MISVPVSGEDDEFELAINFKTAKQIGITNPRVCWRGQSHQMTASREQKENRRSRMFGRIVVCLLLTLFLLTVADAQQSKKIPRIGYLSPRGQAAESARAEAIRLALRELGYIDGQNVGLEYRYGEGKRDRYPVLAAELVRLKVDIIVVAGGDQTVLAAKNATHTIPIVMVGGGIDPVRAGLIESLARPGGNITGVTNLLIQ